MGFFHLSRDLTLRPLVETETWSVDHSDLVPKTERTGVKEVNILLTRLNLSKIPRKVEVLKY